MGWDAFIFGPKGGGITNKEIVKEFDQAAKWVSDNHGFHDIHIYKSGRLIVLDCSDTGQMLNRAGINAWDAGKKHRVLDLKFNWEFEYTKEEAPHYWTARKAIEICQKHDLTIEFSW